MTQCCDRCHLSNEPLVMKTDVPFESPVTQTPFVKKPVAQAGLMAAAWAMSPMKLPRTVLHLGAAVAVWEAAWWARRMQRRGTVYAQALAHAAEMKRPLVVIGAPDGGATSGYSCGDLVVDIASSNCPNSIIADITDDIPIKCDSCVVFVSCVLEYVDGDLDRALANIQRISGGHTFFVGVEPWTITAYAYPGARRTLPPHLR